MAEHEPGERLARLLLRYRRREADDEDSPGHELGWWFTPRRGAGGYCRTGGTCQPADAGGHGHRSLLTGQGTSQRDRQTVAAR